MKENTKENIFWFLFLVVIPLWGGLASGYVVEVLIYLGVVAGFAWGYNVK